MKVVASGFELPTSVVAVPSPGSAPHSPRFFVTEIRGAIKTVANDGSVSKFASVSTFSPRAEWPDYTGEAGLAGLCLAPEQGYVFVTFAYRDEHGVMRNGISRFSARPGTFEGPSQDRRDYSGLLAQAVSAFSHQIGACQVDAGSVYVAVGDGGNPAGARNVDVPLGKLLRLTLEGAPHPENPFAASGGSAALVHAYGLRNPFGFTIVDNRLFAAENGVGIDRLLEIFKGRDHGWDGTDDSIALNALAVFRPTIGPAHVAHARPGAKALAPAQHDRFLIAASNSIQGPGVLVGEMDLERNYLPEPPRYVVQYQGSLEGQAVTGLTVTDEGFYFTPILPVGATGALLEARHQPGHAHVALLGRKKGDPLVARGCLSCHFLNGTGGRVGPALDEASILTRTETRVLDPSYAKYVESLDAIRDPAIVAGKAARHEVLDAPEELRVRVWLVNRIMHPRFDQPDASMPELGIPRDEAERIVDSLLGSSVPGTLDEVREVLASERYWGGIATSALLSGGLLGLAYLRRRRAR